MTEKERMEHGMLYDPGLSEFLDEQARLQDRLHEFNQLRPSQIEEQQKMLKELLAECGENNYVQRPVYANWGGSHVHFGSNIYANYNLTLVDDGHIYVGDWTKFGPNITIATAGHPLLPELRGNGCVLQYNKDVHIGSRVWIGSGTVICPGVTIGDNTVIGAGSVVTKDIPANALAYGVPCRVVREIGERDRKSFFRDEEIDWDEIRRRYRITEEEV